MTVRAEKKEVVDDLVARLQEASSIVLTDYRGLNVAQMTDLRRQFREAGVDFRVVKNTLMRRAAGQAGFDQLEEHLVGPTAAAFSTGDPVGPAKVLVEYARGNEHVQLKIGVLDGNIIGVDDIKRLGNLPSRQQLLAQSAGAIAAPIRGVMYLLSAPLRSFAYGLAALRDQKA